MLFMQCVQKAEDERHSLNECTKETKHTLTMITVVNCCEWVTGCAGCEVESLFHLEAIARR